MTLRKVPGALALGLLASLAAHAALYGGSHAMGGSYHPLLLELALLGGATLLALFGSLAWTESSRASDGSILAARLRERLPGLVGTLTATALWFAAAEAVEPHHDTASPLAMLVALATAGWLVSWLSRTLVALLAGAVIAVRRHGFARRTPLWKRRFYTLVVVACIACARRLFARPPPNALLLRA